MERVPVYFRDGAVCVGCTTPRNVRLLLKAKKAEKYSISPFSIRIFEDVSLRSVLCDVLGKCCVLEEEDMLVSQPSKLSV